MTDDPRPRLTDRVALDAHRSRAAGSADPALFLHDDTLDELQERLNDVNKVFTRPVVVTGHPAFWATAMPNARIVADDETLALEPGAHDLVVHALALHWAEDPVGQLVQCRRALEPDGLFLGFTLAGQTLATLRAALAEAEVAIRGGLSPRVLPMGEIRDLGGLLQRAGFTMPVADLFTRNVSYKSAFHLMRDLRAMGETSALEGRPRHFTSRALLSRAAEVYSETAALPGGRVSARFDLVSLTGWSPGPDQPQPKRPGSATTRLADALGAQETPLPDLSGN